MPKKIVDRITGKTIFRYFGHEMSGPLPTVLYKYLPFRFAQSLIEDGDLMFSTLTWFRQSEEKERGDHMEGAHTHRPENGLEVTIVHRDGDPHIAGKKIIMQQHSFQSEVVGSDYIFIYSTSLQAGLTNFSRAEEKNACVEIHNTVKFASRMKVSLHKWPSTAKTPVIHDRVHYYAMTDTPGTEHSLPDRIVMQKHEDFRNQCEYRFAFGSRTDVFDFEQNRLSLLSQTASYQPRNVIESDHRLKVRIGSLADCCRIL